MKQTPKWAKALYSKARIGASKREIPFLLTVDDVGEMLRRARGFCEVSGLKFSDRREPSGGMRPYAPSIDRINSSRGYEPSNCRLVCVAVNLAMNRWGDAMLRQISFAVVENGISRRPKAQQYRNLEAVSRELDELLMTKREQKARAQLKQSARSV